MVTYTCRVGTEDIGSRIGEQVKAARIERGWNRSHLAWRAGVHPSYVGRLELGVYKQPSLTKVAAIADALGVRMSDLTDLRADIPADLLDEVREVCSGHEELLRRLLADVRRYPPEQRAGALEFGIQAIRLHLGRPEPLPRR